MKLKEELSQALIYAIKPSRGEDVVQYLIDKGADVNYEGSSQTHGTPLYMTRFTTPLIRAVSLGRDDIVKILLNHGADVNQTNEIGKKAINYNRKINYSFKEINQLLGESNVNVDQADENGTTALHFAASRGNYTMCRLLIKNGANVNIKTDEITGYGTTPLMWACWSEIPSFRVIKLLIDNGADIKTKSKTGWEARHYYNFHMDANSVNDRLDIIDLIGEGGED